MRKLKSIEKTTGYFTSKDKKKMKENYFFGVENVLKERKKCLTNSTSFMVVRKLLNSLRQLYLRYSGNIQLGILREISQGYATFDEHYALKGWVSKENDLYIYGPEKISLSNALRLFLFDPLTYMNPLYKKQKIPTESVKGLDLIKKTEWAVMLYENGELKEVHPLIRGNGKKIKWIEPELIEYIKQIRQKHD